ncbi:acyl-CoA thioesterase [Kitasatospora sp. NPDC056138]|uniref:acyl-CoA thioesterase n=1 Tax=Kitasatospora sp. NPDC056138 TaxID=3345724 RepID=UPI0035DCBAC1
MSTPYTNTNPHVLRCPTRWSDVDENGHINNARLVSYIQEGIHDLFHHHAKAARESLFPAGFLIARHEIDYLEQLHHRPEPLLVRLTVERLGRSSAHVRVDVCRDPLTYMTARTVVVARDRASGRSRRLSQSERQFLSEYMPTAAAHGVTHAVTPHAVAPHAVTPYVVAPHAVAPLREQGPVDVRDLERPAAAAVGAEPGGRLRCSVLAGPHGEAEARLGQEQQHEPLSADRVQDLHTGTVPVVPGVEYGQQRSRLHDRDRDRDRDYRRIGDHAPSPWGRALPSARAERPLSPSKSPYS